MLVRAVEIYRILRASVQEVRRMPSLPYVHTATLLRKESTYCTSSAVPLLLRSSVVDDNDAVVPTQRRE